MANMKKARFKGMVTERIGKAFCTMKLHELDEKFNVCHLQSKNNRESAGIVDSVAIRKKKNLNELEIILIERKAIGSRGSLPNAEKESKIEKSLKRACKSLDVKFGLFRMKKGKHKELVIKDV
jgi:hypothetical protein